MLTHRRGGGLPPPVGVAGVKSCIVMNVAPRMLTYNLAARNYDGCVPQRVAGLKSCPYGGQMNFRWVH